MFTFLHKDPQVLSNTVLWMSNAGRPLPSLEWASCQRPWHRGCYCIIIGLAESARVNPLSKRGFATNVRLRKDRPFTVRYIIGMATIPNGFDIVKIQPTKRWTSSPSCSVGQRGNGKRGRFFSLRVKK